MIENMRTLADRSKPLDEIIKEATRHVRRLHTSMVTFVWSGLLGFGVAGAACLLANLNDPAGNVVLEGIRVLALMVVGRLGLLLLPLGAIFVWVLIEEQFARKSCAKLNAFVVNVNGSGEVRSRLTPASIGALLDIIMANGPSSYVGSAPVLVLGEILEAPHTDEEVILTRKQRDLLHELVIQGEWRQEWLNVYGKPEIADNLRCQLRPAVIDSLGMLGDHSSIQVLERFAGKTANPMLRQSAKNAAEQIGERLQYGSEQLLRATQSPASPDTLLRAVLAGKSPHNDPQQLLRAADPASEAERRK